MSLFPTLTESAFVSIGMEINQNILKSNFEDLGKVQVKRKWLYPRRSIQLSYSNIINSEIRTLEQFYINRNGGYSVFTFIMPSTETSDYESEYVGTGTGSQYIFNMPSKSASSVSVYVDGSVQNKADDATSAGDYYITLGGGQDTVDVITFNTAPLAGTRVTTDFTGRLAIRCRFEDSINYIRNKVDVSLNNITINLTGTLIDE